MVKKKSRAELERKGQRSHKGTAMVMKFLRRRRMRREARESEGDHVRTDGTRTDGAGPDQARRDGSDTDGAPRIPPAELERRGQRSNKGSGILRALLERCLAWRDGGEDEGTADS